MTPHDLIKLALKQAGVIGIGQTPLAEDANDAFDLLNMMLAQWTRKRWLVYHLVDLPIQAAGLASYNLGPTRITSIESAFWRYAGGETDTDFSPDFAMDFGPPHTFEPGTVDVPLTVFSSREDWARIGMKGIPGYPSVVWLDAGNPVSQVYVWPTPTFGEIHLIVQSPLTAFPDLTTDISLPDEYREALFYNLVVRLRSAYQRPIDPVAVQLAKASLNTIRVTNSQIAHLQMPDGLPIGGFPFNIYAGGY